MPLEKTVLGGVVIAAALGTVGQAMVIGPLVDEAT